MIYSPTTSNKSNEQFKGDVIDTICKIIDREENDIGIKYILELLSAEKSSNYIKFQHLVNLKRAFSDVSIDNISQLLITHLDEADLEELKGKI